MVRDDATAQSAQIAGCETLGPNEDRRNCVTSPFSWSGRGRPGRGAAEVSEIDDFSFASANSSRRVACRPLDRHGPSKQDLFCYPERRGVEFMAGVAAARDDLEQPVGRQR
jgi:hypothetical protein